MFLDSDAFDELEGHEHMKSQVQGSSPRFVPSTGRARTPPPASMRKESGGASSSSSSSAMSKDVGDEEDDGLGSAGSLAGAGSSSRARMLAQQRELQLKKRQSALQTGGMIRSSLDNGDALRKSAEHQVTPAVRQFSAPKSVRDASADVADTNSEFSRSARMQPVMIAREKEEDEAPRKPPRDSRSGVAAPSDRRFVGKSTQDRYEDEEDEEEPYRRSAAAAAAKKSNSKGGGRRYDDEDEDEDYEDRRRGGGGAKGVSSRRDEYDEEEDYRKGSSRSSRGRGGEDGDGWEDSRGKGPAKESREEAKRERAPPAPTPLNLSDMKLFLTSPLPRSAGVVQCYIRRNKSGMNKLFPIYSLYLKDGDRFLMASKKRPNNKTSNYLVSMSEHDLNRDGVNYLGKLRSNFVGTEFQIFDDGHNPKDEPDVPGREVRRELAGVMYQANVLGSRGPRKMQVALPAVDDALDAGGRSRGAADILQSIKDRNLRDLIYLINKPPRWNEQVGAYVLNFNGRVTMASVKNFQLVDPEEQNTVVLQFGRVGKDEFTMDMHYPITPFQAFAITLSSFDSKIACD